MQAAAQTHFALSFESYSITPLYGLVDFLPCQLRHPASSCGALLLYKKASEKELKSKMKTTVTSADRKFIYELVPNRDYLAGKLVSFSYSILELID
jgi:hypothetical protein